ncbi:ER membrane protein complex subunit 5 [Toxorhynchites rutilus septentrionalis]|uniref:ER membrane protein complex subunit 5 n=1 Tax=Toxorhynchites rutilus septentrionalis TaxID=329112 RepID=UPI002478BECD|nr:ER membrane protein complex subunit 5 [Toxorhynchites rutilus septentrionalis]
MAFLNKLVLFAGFISLLHAAYSAAQHRAYLRITDQEFTNLPVDIVFQAILSLFLIIYNILQVVGDFKEIRAAVDLQAKSWETLGNIPSFYTFNHRGKALSPFYEQPDKDTLAKWGPSRDF